MEREKKIITRGLFLAPNWEIPWATLPPNSFVECLWGKPISVKKPPPPPPSFAPMKKKNSSCYFIPKQKKVAGTMMKGGRRGGRRDASKSFLLSPPRWVPFFFFFSKLGVARYQGPSSGVLQFLPPPFVTRFSSDDEGCSKGSRLSPSRLSMGLILQSSKLGGGGGHGCQVMLGWLEWKCGNKGVS